MLFILCGPLDWRLGIVWWENNNLSLIWILRHPFRLWDSAGREIRILVFLGHIFKIALQRMLKICKRMTWRLYMYWTFTQVLTFWPMLRDDSLLAFWIAVNHFSTLWNVMFNPYKHTTLYETIRLTFPCFYLQGPQVPSSIPAVLSFFIHLVCCEAILIDSGGKERTHIHISFQCLFENSPHSSTMHILEKSIILLFIECCWESRYLLFLLVSMSGTCIINAVCNISHTKTFSRFRK